MTTAVLQILGTAQDAGVPQPNCFCENCRQAMNDPAFKRMAASLAVVLPDEKAWHLIDATPDMKEQMLHMQQTWGLEGKVMDSIFLTHGHMGHYPGLMFLGREAMNTMNVPVYTGKRMRSVLEYDVPWRQLTELGNIDLKMLTAHHTVQLSRDVSITPIEVPHRNEYSETFGFWIVGPEKKVFYVPDIDAWDEWDIDIAEVCKEADICLIDGTFYSEGDLSGSADGGRDLREIPHPFITDTMERLESCVGECEIYVTHMNHSNPAIPNEGAVRQEIETKGFHVAQEGMTFNL